MSGLGAMKTPAEGEALALASKVGLEQLGLNNLRRVYWNLPLASLFEEIVFRQEGKVALQGALVVDSGGHKARAAKDKFIVREAGSEGHVWWGEHNRAFDVAKFDALCRRLQDFLVGRDVFVQDCYVGADPNHRLPIRVITELAWHSLFARNMFLKPTSANEYHEHVPKFTVLCVPSFEAVESIDGTRSGTFIIINFERKLCIIGGTAYGGEIKKSVFTLLNYLLPLRGVLSMHCSANVGADGDVALFFGLSGTGKTSLSADPNRRLIGDDEHGWSDQGIFNFEDGCYAKVIRLSQTAEPQIYAITRRFGTVLENVFYDPVTRCIDLDSDKYTENTRASYPLAFIENSLPEKMGGHPRNIVLLTCDASGVMPPIARLRVDQAIYQFVSGYTAKVGATEVGLGKEPEITFSTCFGAPFMVHHPGFYAELLKMRIERHAVACWLLNTGWVGGAYGVGKRISIADTRALLGAALNGSLLRVEYSIDPVFGFEVPRHCPGIPDELLDPSTAWASKSQYMDKYRQLASRFVENFRNYASNCPPGTDQGGPRL